MIILCIIIVGEIMSLKSKAIKFATKKVTKSKAGKKAIKTAVLGGAVLTGSFLTLLLATEGKRLEEQKSSDN